MGETVNKEGGAIYTVVENRAKNAQYSNYTFNLEITDDLSNLARFARKL